MAVLTEYAQALEQAESEGRELGDWTPTCPACGGPLCYLPRGLEILRADDTSRFHHDDVIPRTECRMWTPSGSPTPASANCPAYSLGAEVTILTRRSRLTMLPAAVTQICIRPDDLIK